jgi:ABC-type antimicrobial peptide transport system permease subunit
LRISQRTQEFGVRLALGATTAQVMGLVATEGVVAAVSLVVALVSLLATGVPAWRASRVDPTTALRTE